VGVGVLVLMSAEGAFFLEGPEGRDRGRAAAGSPSGGSADSVRDRGDPFTRAPFRHGDMQRLVGARIPLAPRPRL